MFYTQSTIQHWIIQCINTKQHDTKDINVAWYGDVSFETFSYALKIV